LLNIDGYYDLLIGFLDHALAEQFVKKHHHALLMVEKTPDVLLERFAHYRPPAAKHWVGKNET
jgi:predicted Rossmann-fold nucleotide-binding protein